MLRVAILGATIALLAVACVAEDHAHWGYSQQGKDWGGICSTGTRQSPIDVRPVGLAMNEKVKVDLHYGSVSGLKMKHNGHALQVDDTAAGYSMYNGHKYLVRQFYFHAPSENTINGVNADAEMHIVHQKEGATGTKDLLVVGVLFRLGGPSEFLDAIGFTEGPTTAHAEHVIGKNVDLRLNNLDGWMYHWQGSLTTPPCSETVAWFLRAQPAQISAAQLNFINNIFGGAGMGNNRATQPLYSRTVSLVQVTVAAAALESPYTGRSTTVSNSPGSRNQLSTALVGTHAYVVSFALPLAYVGLKLSDVNKAAKSVLCKRLKAQHFSCSRLRVDAMYPPRATGSDGQVSFSARINVDDSVLHKKGALPTGAATVTLLVKSLSADASAIAKRILHVKRIARHKRLAKLHRLHLKGNRKALKKLKKARKKKALKKLKKTRKKALKKKKNKKKKKMKKMKKKRTHDKKKHKKKHTFKHHSKAWHKREHKLDKANKRARKKVFKADMKHLSHEKKQAKKAIKKTDKKIHKIKQKMLKIKEHVASAKTSTKKQMFHNQLTVLKAKEKKLVAKKKHLKKTEKKLQKKEKKVVQKKLESDAHLQKQKVKHLKARVAHATTAQKKTELTQKLKKAEAKEHTLSKKVWTNQKTDLAKAAQDIKALQKKQWTAQKEITTMDKSLKKLQHKKTKEHKSSHHHH